MITSLATKLEDLGRTIRRVALERPAVILTSGVLLLVDPRLAPAQDALRTYLSGEAATRETLRDLRNENRPYTYKTGDFRLLVTPSLGLDYNDNINTSSDDQKDDWILRPMLRLDASYPVSQHNLLRVNLGVGYDYYFKNDNYGGVRLESGSEVAFDMFVEHVLINFHDRFRYTQDPGTEASVANAGRYGGLDNTAGLTTSWDWQSGILTAGYDHQNFISSASEYEYQDRASELVLARAGFRVLPVLTTGVEGTASFTAYDQQVLNDNTGYSAGAYGDWEPGSRLRVQLRGGYTLYDFDQTSLTVPATDQDTWYLGLSISHAVTDAISYSLSAGRELRLGIQSDVTEDWYVRPGIRWAMTKKVSLNGGFSYEHGKQDLSAIGSFSEEQYDQYATTLGAAYQLTKRLNLSLTYRLTIRSSDLASRDYTQNVVGLTLTYLFHAS